MKDGAFRNELWINAYKNQIDGYPMGHPRRTNFRPIVSTVPKGDGTGTCNRQRTLDGTAYTFTDEERELLLDES